MKIHNRTDLILPNMDELLKIAKVDTTKIESLIIVYMDDYNRYLTHWFGDKATHLNTQKTWGALTQSFKVHREVAHTYYLNINRHLTPGNTNLTIAHELIHLNQYTNRRLIRFTQTLHIALWNGRLVRIANMTAKDYPWEIEAYQFERKLFIEMINRGLIFHKRLRYQ